MIFSNFHSNPRRALGPALATLILIGAAAAQPVPEPAGTGSAPAVPGITIRTGATGPASDLCSFDGFHVDVVLPRETATAAGDAITVTLRSEGTGEEVELELTSTGAARGAVTYTNADAVTLAKGAAWSSIGPLPLWTMYPLETVNEDTLTITHGGASATFTVYDTPWQRALARIRDLGTALRDFYAGALSAGPGVSPAALAACHAKLAAAKNLLVILEREDLNDVRKVRLGEAYVDLLGADPVGWRRADAPDGQLGYLGIVLGSQEEAAAVGGALDLAREDIRGFRNAAIGHVVDGVYDVVTNVTGVNQASMVFLGTDARGRRVTVAERFLAGIDLGSRTILLGASMTGPARGGGNIPGPRPGARGRRPVARAPKDGNAPPAAPSRAAGEAARIPDPPHTAIQPPGPPTGPVGAPRRAAGEGAAGNVEPPATGGGPRGGDTNPGQLRAPRADGEVRRGDTDAGALRRPDGEASAAPPPPARGLGEGTPADLANFGLPDRPWARDFVSGARRDLASTDRAVSASGKNRLMKLFTAGKEFQTTLAPEFLGRLDTALGIVERIVAHPEFRGAFRWDDAWLHLLLHAERQRGLAPHLAVEAVIASRTPYNVLTVKMVQDATGLGRAAAGSIIRRAAERLGLDDAGLRRLGIEVPELSRGLFRPGDAARADPPPPSFGYGGVAPAGGTSGAILPTAGLAGAGLAARAAEAGESGAPVERSLAAAAGPPMPAPVAAGLSPVVAPPGTPGSSIPPALSAPPASPVASGSPPPAVPPALTALGALPASSSPAGIGPVLPGSTMISGGPVVTLPAPGGPSGSTIPMRFPPPGRPSGLVTGPITLPPLPSRGALTGGMAGGMIGGSSVAPVGTAMPAPPVPAFALPSAAPTRPTGMLVLPPRPAAGSPSGSGLLVPPSAGATTGAAAGTVGGIR